MKTVFTLFILMIVFNQSFAQPGTLDKSFGDTGVVLDKNIAGILNKIGAQSDGKIIGAGGGAINNSVPFLIIRYNTDGNIDSSFGINGITGNNQQHEIDGVAIQKDDAIIAVSGYSFDVELARYKKDGELDSTFGRDGTVTTSIGNNLTDPVNVLVQSDGKIITGGYIINQPNEARQGFLIRYLPDGSLDKSFGNNGIAILGEIDGDKSFGNVYAIALQPNGQILMSAVSNGGVVYRFNADGSIDNNFGIEGIANFQQSDNIVNHFLPIAWWRNWMEKLLEGGKA
ncbi:MAG: hypothetical protein ABJB05_07380 [Parafilimonas sp.]